MCRTVRGTCTCTHSHRNSACSRLLRNMTSTSCTRVLASPPSRPWHRLARGTQPGATARAAVVFAPTCQYRTQPHQPGDLAYDVVMRHTITASPKVPPLCVPLLPSLFAGHRAVDTDSPVDHGAPPWCHTAWTHAQLHAVLLGRPLAHRCASADTSRTGKEIPHQHMHCQVSPLPLPSPC